MANKTQATIQNVGDFLDTLTPERRKACRTLGQIMRRVTGARAKMWGKSIVGYGSYHYVYDSGREGDFFLAGYSPRKANLTVYVMDGFDRHGPLMKKIGPHKTGKSCLYLKSLEGIDLKALETLLERSVKATRKKHPD